MAGVVARRTVTEACPPKPLTELHSPREPLRVSAQQIVLSRASQGQEAPPSPGP
jgi:hypothetical protein